MTGTKQIQNIMQKQHIILNIFPHDELLSNYYTGFFFF